MESHLIEQHITAMPLPSLVRQAMDAVRRRGGDIFVVGGAIRDWVWAPSNFNPDIVDWDLTTNLATATLRELSSNAHPGERFGTFRLGPRLEVTIMRQEHGYEDRRHPDALTCEQSIEIDLLRRDFTVNAVAFDGRRVVAAAHALDDLARRRLRAVGSAARRFAEDPLRMLRLIRFMAVCDALADPQTWAALLDHRADVATVSRERRLEEFTRFLAAPPSRWQSWSRAGMNAALEWPEGWHQSSAWPMVSAPHHPAARLAAYALLSQTSVSGLSDWIRQWPLERSWRAALRTLLELGPDLDPECWRRLARNPRQRHRWIFHDLAVAFGVVPDQAAPIRLALTAQEIRTRWQLSGPSLSKALQHLTDRVDRNPSENTAPSLATLLERFLNQNPE